VPLHGGRLRFLHEMNHVATDDAGEVSRLLQARGIVHVQVSGKSMVPWIRPGDVLVVHRAGIREVSPGEVVLFNRKGKLVVHRAVENKMLGTDCVLVTKGDAVDDADGLVSAQEFLGRAMLLVRGNREIYLESPAQMAQGRFLSRLSVFSRYWLPVARAMSRAARPLSKRFAPSVSHSHSGDASLENTASRQHSPSVPVENRAK
jgi:signal peptidase I